LIPADGNQGGSYEILESLSIAVSSAVFTGVVRGGTD
jgi:hypothetical protein